MKFYPKLIHRLVAVEIQIQKRLFLDTTCTKNGADQELDQTVGRVQMKGGAENVSLFILAASKTFWL